jgi:hypothetical protein
MTRVDTDRLIRQFIGGDAAASARIVTAAAGSDDPIILVAAAVIDPAAPGLIERATASAATTRDRQLVAIATAHLAGDADRVDALARDHLVDHPDNSLVTWIAGAATAVRALDNPRPHEEGKERPQTTADPAQLSDA